MMRSLVVVAVVAFAAFAACKGEEAKPTGTVVESRILESATFALPQGWTSSYGKDDPWLLTSPDGRTVRLERTDERYVASPDAFMQHVKSRYGGRLVTIEQREYVGKGFVITLAAFKGDKDPNPQRTTFVVRPLGKAWFSCHADGLEDEMLRNEMIGLCRSARL
jgi:hypothetical protein